MYKQCRIKKGNTYTYKWLHEKLAIEGNLVDYKNEKWKIDKVWHFKEDKRFIAEMQRIG